jgi:hypothetical protein
MFLSRTTTRRRSISVGSSLSVRYSHVDDRCRRLGAASIQLIEAHAETAASGLSEELRVSPAPR